MKKMLFLVSLLNTTLVLSSTVSAEIDAARKKELSYFIQQDCGSCHGMTLKGGLGPALLPENLSGKAKDYLVTTILEGRENTAMPAWKPMLSFDDASWIVEQLLTGKLVGRKLAHNKPAGAMQ